MDSTLIIAGSNSLGTPDNWFSVRLGSPRRQYLEKSGVKPSDPFATPLEILPGWLLASSLLPGLQPPGLSTHLIDIRDEC